MLKYGWLAGIILFVNCSKHAVRQLSADEVPETKFPVVAFHSDSVNAAIGGFLSVLPSRYNVTTKLYPLIVSLHGAGQIGDGSYAQLQYLLASGIPKVVIQNKFPASFSVDGNSQSFIILAPQFKYWPSVADVASFINSAKKNYRVDVRRIYITGLSMGGVISSDVGATYPELVTAIVSMSGVCDVTDSSIQLKCKTIAEKQLPVWVFHNDKDPLIGAAGPGYFVSLINSYNPRVDAKITLFNNASHDSWTKATDPDYKENGLNIYKWMLQYSK